MTIWATLCFSVLVLAHTTPNIRQSQNPARMRSSQGERGIKFYLFVETVEQTLLAVLRDDLECDEQKKVTHVALDFLPSRRREWAEERRRRVLGGCCSGVH